LYEQAAKNSVAPTSLHSCTYLSAEKESETGRAIYDVACCSLYMNVKWVTL